MFTDVFIKRPVIALSLNLAILIAGCWGLTHLPLSLYPKVVSPVVEISTLYPGASAEIVQNYVTTPVQTNLNDIEGIDYITSSSNQGMSQIDLHFRLGEDIDKSISTVMRRVQAIASDLPVGSLAPNISGGESNHYYFILQATSSHPALEWVTNYLNRMVVPQLELIDGVSQSIVWGPHYTMDIQLNPEQLIAYGLTAEDVVTALQNYNQPAAPGKTYGWKVNYALNPNTTIQTPNDFNEILIKNGDGKSIYLKDIGIALFHGVNENFQAYFNGKKGDGIAIGVNPNSNPLRVGKNLEKMLPTLQKSLAANIQLGTVFDITKFISASLHEVMVTIIESLIVVVIVMLLLLGSPRSVLIPLSTIPLSLIGVCFFMWLCHFSFNLLTLLALVLAIGLVVDDAIVVVENVVRHLSRGSSALDAALIGTREIAQPVIAMTLTLAAVYTPMLLASGITGHLFREFAMTLAAAVIISGIIALTLSPLFCSRLINQKSLNHSWVNKAELRVNRLRDKYIFTLKSIMANQKKVAIVWLSILLSCGVLYQYTAHELIPEEDTGILQIAARAPVNSNLNYLEKYRPDLENVLNLQSKNITNYVEVLQNNTLFGYISLLDWSKRKFSSHQLQTIMQKELNKIAGLSPFVSNISLLPGSSGDGITLVLLGNVGYPELYAAAKKLENRAQSSGHFLFVHDDLQYNQPQIDLNIDPIAASAMKVTPSAIATQLTRLLSQGKVQQFTWRGENYDVHISIPQHFRRNPEDIGQLQIANQDGNLIPLNSMTNMTTTVVPQTLNQFQKMNSVSITAVPAQNTGFSEALTLLQHYTDDLGKQFRLDYSDSTRQFLQEGQRSLWIFVLAILFIFLVLSIQFNRFRDAFIILLGSVPLALFGALLPLWLGLGTINIYTQIGLLTLVGLISKHGILLTEFANKAQDEEQLAPFEAIIKAAKLRFRPIIMTTAAMVVGAIPLVLASGAGAESRRAIGLVIVFGLCIGTLFTLFIMPVLYLWFGRNFRSQ